MDNKSVHLLHFNDTYDINKASSFVAKIQTFLKPESINIFSGDLFFPSLESSIKHGTQMIKVMEESGVHYSIPGNHDLEHGEPHFISLKNEMSCKWIVSNFKNNVTGRPLGECFEYDIIERNGVKIGIFGLIDQTWLETSALNLTNFTLDDFIQKGKEVSAFLRSEGCELIIAGTHMKNQDDELLIAAESDIDIVLGGHEHVFLLKRDNEKILLKSGTNFEMFSDIKVTFSDTPFEDESKNPNEPNSSFFYFMKSKSNEMDPVYKFSLKRPTGYLNVILDTIEVNEDDPKSPVIEEYMVELKEIVDRKFKTPIFKLEAELDARSITVRSKENALGSFIADMIRYELGVDITFVQGGAIRADRIYPEGHIMTYADMCTLFPITDTFWVHEVTGADLKILLEQSYQALPNALGSFIHLGGVRISLDISKEPMNRVDPDEIYVNGIKLDYNRTYRLAAASFLSKGKDGFTHFPKVKCIGVEEKSLVILDMLIQFFDMLYDDMVVKEIGLFKEISELEINNLEGKINERPDVKHLFNGDLKENLKAIKKFSSHALLRILKSTFVKGTTEINGKEIMLMNMKADGRLHMKEQ